MENYSQNIPMDDHIFHLSRIHSPIVDEIPFILDKYDGNCILHQDNDGKHNSALCRGILERYCINWNKAPPYSPDLNTIEEVWAVLKRFVLKKRCSTLEKLQDAVNQFVRRKLSPEKCQKYISNLKKVYL